MLCISGTLKLGSTITNYIAGDQKDIARDKVPGTSFISYINKTDQSVSTKQNDQSVPTEQSDQSLPRLGKLGVTASAGEENQSFYQNDTNQQPGVIKEIDTLTKKSNNEHITSNATPDNAHDKVSGTSFTSHMNKTDQSVPTEQSDQSLPCLGVIASASEDSFYQNDSNQQPGVIQKADTLNKESNNERITSKSALENDQHNQQTSSSKTLIKNTANKIQKICKKSKTKKTEKLQKNKKEEVNILDLQSYFEDFNTTHVNKESIEFLKMVRKKASTYEEEAKNYSGTKYSIKYFVIDENLMRLLEELDKLRLHQNADLLNEKIETINYINQLHKQLDENAQED